MNQKKAKYISFLETGIGEIVELIGDKTSKMFIVHNIQTEKSRIVNQYVLNGQVYLPPKDELVEKGTILLPAYPENFGEVTDLLTFIEDYINRYVDISPRYSRLAAYYALLSWVYDSFEVLPYLRVLGDYGTGKTRFQKVVGSICYKPMFAGGATTPSPIFRIIDIYRGTLIIDEADFRLSDADAEIIKIFNCGYTKGISVLRTEGDNKERVPVSYDVFGPKIIATRKRFEDHALESRCLTEIMTGNPKDTIPIHLPKEFEKESLKIRNMLLSFRLKHYAQIEVDISLVIPKIEPRINQIILPILSIITDEKSRQEIRDFITDYAAQLKSGRIDELPAQILQVMKIMVNEGVPLHCKDIAKRINETRDQNQGEYLVSPTKVGKINASTFNFKTRYIRGLSEILWDEEKARKFFDRYGLNFDEKTDGQVEDVEDVDVSQDINKATS